MSMAPSEKLGAQLRDEREDCPSERDLCILGEPIATLVECDLGVESG